jgi:hypothetical protein
MSLHEAVKGVTSTLHALYNLHRCCSEDASSRPLSHDDATHPHVAVTGHAVGGPARVCGALHGSGLLDEARRWRERTSRRSETATNRSS